MSVKEDEKILLAAIRKAGEFKQFPYVRFIVHDLGMSEKRAAYILEKWSGRGEYEYGVNVLAGWLTEGR